MEVAEIKVQNSGLDNFPLMLKKQKVPKTPIMTHYPGMSLKKEEFYEASDLICGKVITIFGRPCYIYDCDAFTSEWFRQRLGIEQQGVNVDHKPTKIMYNATPSYNGIGSEEDTMGSVKALVPKVPKKDEQKVFKCDMHVLRFQCKLVSTEPDDETREFIVSFFCGDDTIQVYEVCDKNSGRMGGKFLERKKHKNPVTQKYYAEKDFLIGKTIYLTGWRFQI